MSYDSLRHPLRAALTCAFLAAASLAQATPVQEAPWRPDAAAYRATLFHLNLAPVPWNTVETAWTAPYPGAETDTPPIELVTRLAGPDAAAAISAALDARDAPALHAAMTRALTAALLDRLDAAESALDGGNAAPLVAEAHALYRAIEDGARAGDPQAAREIGLAWLDLASATGSRGVLGAGQLAADTGRFSAAKQRIASFLTENYGLTTPAHRFSALPASAPAEAQEPAFLPPGHNIADQDPLPRLVLNFEEQGIDESDLPLIAYGDMLFDSAQIFGGPAKALGLACSTCHNRSDINRDFFIPGTAHQPGAVDVDGAFFNPIFNDLRDDPIDIPTLRGLRFTGPYGRDGRFASLRDFTRNVIVNEFAGPEPTPFMLDALVAYMNEFDFLPNSRVTPDGRLTDKADDAARRGELLFRRPFAQMGGQSCASCHTPDGNFTDRKSHDIGSAAPAYDGARAQAFDTPTLLGTVYTAPYFHDGSLPTLAAVTGWFNDRYGLGLTYGELADLTAYVEAVGSADEPYEVFDERNTPFRLAFEELTTFASTLDTLIPAQDRFHATLLIETVSGDLAADASVMGNLDAKPQVYALAETLESVGAAIRADDWQTAATEWERFKALQAEIDERMY